MIAAATVRGYQLETDPVVEFAGLQADDSSIGFQGLTSRNENAGSRIAYFSVVISSAIAITRNVYKSK